MKPKIAIIRGKFLNRYEMQFYEPLVKKFDIKAFGSLNPYHDTYAFPVRKLASPMDLPDFPYKMPVLNRLFTDAHYLYGLERELRGFDIVHSAETYYRYTQQALNARRKGYVKRVIATVLENIPFNNEGIYGRKAYKARALRELDHIIALTELTKKTLLAEGADPSKISVIKHYVNTRTFRPDLTRKNNRDVTLLYSGRIETYKGIYDLLEAFYRILRDPQLNDFKITLWFVGAGSELAKLLKLERELGISQFIKHGSVPYGQMPGIYRKADIFIAPSRPTKTWIEQYNTALLEAQASGLAVITTLTGGIPENIGDAGLLCEPGDVRAIAGHLKNLIINRSLRRRYGKKARRRALKIHDISVGAEKLTALYMSLL